MKYEQRESQKKAGWELFYHNEDLEKQYTGSLDILEAWYERAIENKKSHPDFETYVSMLHLEKLFKERPEVVSKLREKFRYHDKPIKSGYTHF